jgi:hypothetical protein
MNKTNGTPVNTKSLLAFIFNQMEQLNNGDIDANTACAQAKLASQASNLLNYELKRTLVTMQLEQRGLGIKASDVRLREIESKGFDDSVVQE